MIDINPPSIPPLVPGFTVEPWRPLAVTAGQPQDASDFVAKLLQRSPIKRYTAEEASQLTHGRRNALPERKLLVKVGDGEMMVNDGKMMVKSWVPLNHPQYREMTVTMMVKFGRWWWWNDSWWCLTITGEWWSIVVHDGWWWLRLKTGSIWIMVVHSHGQRLE